MFFGKSGDCMVIRTFRRCENKYLVTEDKKNELLKRFEPLTRPDAYCIGGKTYSIYNIYYDTPDDQLIRNSISKPPYKEKLRLRSYYPVLKDEDELFLFEELILEIVGDIPREGLTAERGQLAR